MPQFFNVTPGIFITEIDATYLPGAVAEIGSALVGLSEQGKAFYPQLVTNWQDWLIKFGNVNSDYYAPYGAKNYLKYRKNLLFTRVLGYGEVPHTGDSTSNDVGLPLMAKINVTLPSLSAGATTATEHLANVSSATAWAVIGIIRPNLLNAATSFSLTSSYNVSSTALAPTLSLTATSSGSGTQYLTITDLDNLKSFLSTDPHVQGWTGTLTGFYLDETFTPYCSLNATNYRNAHGFGSWYTSATGNSQLNLTSSYASPVIHAETNLKGYTFASTPWIVSQPVNNNISRLFRFHTLADGNSANKTVKIQISNLASDYDYSTGQNFTKFDVLLRKIDDTDLYPEVLERFLECNLIPTHQNYIARKIGDIKETWNFSYGTLTKVGDWANKSNYVRIEMISNPTESDITAVSIGNPYVLEPRGFEGISVPNINNSVSAEISSLAYESYRLNQDLGLANKYHKRACFGFDTTTTNGSVELCNAMKYTQIKGVLAVDYDEYSVNSVTASNTNFIFIPVLTGATTTSLTADYIGVIDIQFIVPFQGGYDGWGKVSSYRTKVNELYYNSFLKAVEILSNTELYDFNLLFIPGTEITNERHVDIITAGVQICEDRKDAMYVPDLVPFTDTPMLENSGDSILQKYDTNYAAYYAPGWVKIYDPDNDLFIKCPQSIVQIGLYAYNDTIANVWDSAAGPIRGDVNSLLWDVQYKLTQEHKNAIYNFKGNPIAYYTNTGFMNDTARTMQSRESALTDVPTRRVLIYLEKAVSTVGRKILNEPNNDNSRQRFYNEIQPAFRTALEMEGISNYKLHIDKYDPNKPKTLSGTFYVYPMDRITEIKISFVLSRDASLFSEE